MITHNASVDKFIEYIKDKDVYIYGVGDFYRRLSQKVIFQYIHKKSCKLHRQWSEKEKQLIP